MSQQNLRFPLPFFLGWLLLLPVSVLADISVLVHGYNSDAQDWYQSGIIKRMEKQGWSDGGQYRWTPQQVTGPGARPEGERLIFSVNLPNDAPILIQVAYIQAVLQTIRTFADDEPLALVGHSAGGVVARACMVLHPEHRVSTLITIASPHLGTNAATAGALVADSPLGMMARMLGEKKLAYSGPLLSELTPQKPGNFLGWLNVQPHPPARYFSVVRAESSFLKGDPLISRESQDLRNVYALGGQAFALPSKGGHTLSAEDADIIASILSTK